MTIKKNGHVRNATCKQTLSINTGSILHAAQRMGLVEAPTQPLTEDEWKKAKEKSNKRDDSKQPCVICKEDFGVQEQVQL